MIANQFTAAADGYVALAAGIGIARLTRSFRAYSFDFFSVGAAEKPDYSVGIHFLGCHRTAVHGPSGRMVVSIAKSMPAINSFSTQPDCRLAPCKLLVEIWIIDWRLKSGLVCLHARYEWKRQQNRRLHPRASNRFQSIP